MDDQGGGQASKPEQMTILLCVSQSTRGYPHPSQTSLHALDWVLQKLIHKSHRDEFKVLLVHVKVPDEDGLTGVDSVYATADDLEEGKKKDKKKILHLLEVFVKKCNEVEVSVEGFIKLGDPKEVICSEVLRIKPDMLVLGSRGLEGLQRMFVGGVSNYVSRKVECPVLIIKRRHEDLPDDISED